jgi:hypothetical protein
MPVLLLTVAGRGTARCTPIPSYFEDDGCYVVRGSGGGQRDEPQWFRTCVKLTGRSISARQILVTVVAEGTNISAWAALMSIGPFP